MLMISLFRTLNEEKIVSSERVCCYYIIRVVLKILIELVVLFVVFELRLPIHAQKMRLNVKRKKT